MMSKNEIIAKHYGLDRQLDQTIEECAELIVAIRKFKRYPSENHRQDNLLEEIGDVEIMLDQLKYLFNAYLEVEFVKGRKINRELERIENETTNV